MLLLSKLHFIKEICSLSVPPMQFVYDAWFGCMSPDREFPAEIRRALNCAFGELAVRSRRVDPRAILRCAERCPPSPLPLPISGCSRRWCGASSGSHVPRLLLQDGAPCCASGGDAAVQAFKAHGAVGGQLWGGGGASRCVCVGGKGGRGEGIAKCAVGVAFSRRQEARGTQR